MKLSCTLSVLVFSVLVAVAQTPLKQFRSVSFTHMLDDKLLVCADDGTHGDELWVSNGTTEGTRLLKDIRPGFAGAAISDLFNYRGKTYFNAYNEQYQSELWVTDGTPERTELFADLSPSGNYYSGTNPALLTEFKGLLYFTSSQGHLYRTDGDKSNIELVDKIDFGRIQHLNVVGDKLYYYKGSDILHWTNGTTKGDIDLPLDLDETYFKTLYTTGKTLYAIRSSSYDQHIKLYVLNNATLKWTKILDIKAPVYGSNYPEQFTVVEDKLFFNLRTAYDNLPDTDEIWVATETGALKLKSFEWNRHSYGSSTDNFYSFNGNLYFSSGELYNRALWKSDGTVEGTQKLHDVVLVKPYGVENSPITAEDRMYFAGSNTANGSGALWSTDGTIAGTRMELDVTSNRGGIPFNLKASKSVIYFTTALSGQTDATLWSTAPAPEINVATRNGAILPHQGDMYFTLYKDRCVVEQLEIRNDGAKALAMGAAQVNGSDFSIHGKIPAVLLPGEKFGLDVLYYSALQQGTPATLTIESSDDNESPYIITLKPPYYPSLSSALYCKLYNDRYSKMLLPVDSTQAILLSNNRVKELQPKGTLVGTLSVSGENGVTYSLASGDGDTHNDMFVIEGAQLKTNKSFIYRDRYSYVIRVKAVLSDQTVKEAILRVAIENTNEQISFGGCNKRIERLDYQLLDIAANGSGDLFAVSSSGTIQKSSDGGNTWSVIDLNYNVYLNKIIFFGSTGFIQGANILLKSEDDGRTWFQLSVPNHDSYNFSAWFFNANVGYASASRGEIYYTNDGGQTWSVRYSGWPFSGNFRSFFFITEEKGFASFFSGELYRTVDGGRSWVKVNLDSFGYYQSPINAIHFFSESQGLMVTNDYTANSTDGGITWQKVVVPHWGGFNGMEVINATTAYIYGDVGVMKTTDKGSTWAIVGDQPLSEFASAGGKLFGIRNTDSYSYNRTGRNLRVSNDDGKTWLTVQTLGNDHHLDIDFPSEKFGFLVSASASYWTNDEGVSWHQVPWTTAIQSAHFFNEQHGILNDRERIYETTDGGQTINEISVIEQAENSYATFGKLYAVSNNLIFNYGSSVFCHSSDGGHTWKYDDDMKLINIMDMSFPSSSVGYVIDLFGEVYKSVDAGESWVKVYTRHPYSSDVHNAIFFVNDLVGYRGGVTFSKTTDGGVTWTAIFTPIQSQIVDLWFDSEAHGFAIPEGASIYETFDGGATWKQYYIFDGKRPYDVHFSKGDVYIAGESGYLARYKNALSAPLQPGYIAGKKLVCAGDVQTYSLPSSVVSLYEWKTGAVVLKEESSSIEVYFPEAGEYAFAVKAVNSCGSSESRSLQVRVVAAEEPVISGDEIVSSGTTTSYVIENSSSAALYHWSVSPVFPFQDSVATDKISLTWPASESEYTIQTIALDSVSGCTTMSEVVSVRVSLTVGVESEIEDGIHLYPNPATSVLKIESEEIIIDEVEIYTINGKLIWTSTFAPYASGGLPVEKLRSGVYVVKLYGQNNEVAVKRIVKY